VTVADDDDLVGYLLISAEDPDLAEALIRPGNPTYRAAGTIEIRELIAG
jgi:hypothetical protein